MERAATEAIRSVNLVKVYHGKVDVEALKGVSLSVESGQLYTLLGPNGAGKTTFLRIVSTQLLPTDGEVYLLGYDVVRQPEEVRRHIAVVPQDSIAYHNLTPWEYAYYFARLYGVPDSEVKKNAELALKTVDIWHLRDRACGSLSGGEQKRAIIASALSF
ncbi:MAG: ATP-binding cassette domain-containing protein [Nitrososphaeria archaeon]